VSAMEDEPELHIIKFPELPGAAEWRAERDRHRAEARRRYIAHLNSALEQLRRTDHLDPEAEAAAVLDALVVWNDISTGHPCPCSCHPRLPEGDVHDYGFDCSCRHTPEERATRFDAWEAELDAFWASPEGQAITAARRAEEDQLAAWLSDHPEVVVRTHGGAAPEQWRGEVDGHSFYFRERHDHWRIELDLRPSGRYYRAWVSGDLDDDASYEWRKTDEGDVIAEGTTAVDGYGNTPVERVQFIVGLIRTHLRRQECTLHTVERDELELLLGRPPVWCPECGTELS
jgi:hypothetical protein